MAMSENSLPFVNMRKNDDMLLNHLQDMFHSQLEPDVVQMILAECNYNAESAIEALLKLTSEPSEHQEIAAKTVFAAQPCVRRRGNNKKISSTPATGSRGDRRPQSTSTANDLQVIDRAVAANNTITPAGNDCQTCHEVTDTIRDSIYKSNEDLYTDGLTGTEVTNGLFNGKSSNDHHLPSSLTRNARVEDALSRHTPRSDGYSSLFVDRGAGDAWTASPTRSGHKNQQVLSPDSDRSIEADASESVGAELPSPTTLTSSDVSPNRQVSAMASNKPKPDSSEKKKQAKQKHYYKPHVNNSAAQPALGKETSALMQSLLSELQKHSGQPNVVRPPQQAPNKIQTNQPLPKVQPTKPRTIPPAHNKNVQRKPTTPSPVVKKTSDHQVPPAAPPPPPPPPIGHKSDAVGKPGVPVQMSLKNQLLERIRHGQRVLILLRGCPGSGKSTLAKQMKKNGVILSADTFFTKNGVYEFDSLQLSEAHTSTRNATLKYMQSGVSPIVIDNTNVESWEMEPYVLLAIKLRYYVALLEPDTPWRYSAPHLARMTTHGVPLMKISAMLDRFEHDLTVNMLLKRLGPKIDHHKEKMQLRNRKLECYVREGLSTQEALAKLKEAKKSSLHYHQQHQQQHLPPGQNHRTWHRVPQTFAPQADYKPGLLSNPYVLSIQGAAAAVGHFRTVSTQDRKTNNKQTPTTHNGNLTRSRSIPNLSQQSSAKAAPVTGSPKTVQALTGSPKTVQALTGSPKTVQVLTGSPKTVQALTGSPKTVQALTGSPKTVQALQPRQAAQLGTIDVKSESGQDLPDAIVLSDCELSSSDDEDLWPCEGTGNDWDDILNLSQSSFINDMAISGPSLDPPSVLSENMKDLMDIDFGVQTGEGTSQNDCSASEAMNWEIPPYPVTEDVVSVSADTAAETRDSSSEEEQQDFILLNDDKKDSVKLGTSPRTEGLEEIRREDAMRALNCYFSSVPTEDLQDFLDRCEGDVHWAANLLLDAGYEWNVDSGVLQSSESRSADVDCKVGAEAPRPPFTKVDAGGGGRSVPNDGGSRNKKKDLEETGERSLPSTLVLRIDPIFALQLEQLFGPVGFHVSPESYYGSDLNVSIDAATARRIHSFWSTSLNKKFEREEATLNEMLKDPGYKYAKKLQEKEDAQLAASMNKPQWDPEFPPLNESAILEAAKQQFPSNVRDLASKIKRQQLYEMFPKIDRKAVDDVFLANNGCFLETVEAIEVSFCPNEEPRLVVAKVEEYENAWLQIALKENQLLNKKEELDVADAQNRAIVPTYEDLRAEATVHYHQRQECFKRAQQAYDKDRKAVASFYSQQGHIHSQKLRDANKRAKEIILERKNAGHNDDTLDLHELYVQEAIEALVQFLERKKSQLKNSTATSLTVFIITGKGAHSDQGTPRIKPAVLGYLLNHRYSIHEANAGVLEVKIVKDAHG